jgi:hypothetical protein
VGAIPFLDVREVPAITVFSFFQSSSLHNRDKCKTRTAEGGCATRSSKPSDSISLCSFMSFVVKTGFCFLQSLRSVDGNAACDIWFCLDTLSKPSGAPAYPTPALRQNAKERGTHCVGNALRPHILFRLSPALPLVREVTH